MQQTWLPGLHVRGTAGESLISAAGLFFLHQFHAALGAITRRVFHDFGVHRAGILVSTSIARCRLAFSATREIECGETERHRRQGGQYRFCFHRMSFARFACRVQSVFTLSNPVSLLSVGSRVRNHFLDSLPSIWLETLFVRIRSPQFTSDSTQRAPARTTASWGKPLTRSRR